MAKYQTEQRKRLISFFENSNHRTLSAQEIYSELGDQDISISAIYRNLAEMEKDGLLCKISEKNRQGALYQYVNPDTCMGIIHLKCQSCQSTFHLNKHVSQMIIGLAQDDFNFTVNDAAAVIYGQCKNCSQNL